VQQPSSSFCETNISLVEKGFIYALHGPVN